MEEFSFTGKRCIVLHSIAHRYFWRVPPLIAWLGHLLCIIFLLTLPLFPVSRNERRFCVVRKLPHDKSILRDYRKWINVYILYASLDWCDLISSVGQIHFQVIRIWNSDPRNWYFSVKRRLHKWQQLCKSALPEVNAPLYSIIQIYS